MKIFFTSLFQTSILTLFCYFIYIFPIQILLKWGFNKTVHFQNLILSTLLISACISYYFRTKTKSKLLKLITHLGIGSLYLIALITLIILIINQFYPLINSINILLVTLLSSLLICFSKFKGKNLTIKTLSLKSNKVTTLHSFIFISDVHIGSQSSYYLQKIVNKINSINPEIVLIGGDLIDSSAIKISDLDPLKNINVPIYFITGNHEYYLKNYQKTLSNLNKVGIKWLNNSSITHKELTIIGINDNQSIKQKNKLITKKIKSNTYNIALVHKPSCFDTLQKKPDLMLSGHTHNGQTFPFNFFVKLVFPKSYGLYKQGQKNLYVSSGAGTWGPQMRLGSVNEIVYIQLMPPKKN